MAEKTKFAGSNQPTCLKCKYFDTITNMVSGKTATICRIDPAKAHAVPAMTGPGQLQWMVYSGWPEVTASDWCGKHERSLDS